MDQTINQFIMKITDIIINDEKNNNYIKLLTPTGTQRHLQSLYV